MGARPKCACRPQNTFQQLSEQWAPLILTTTGDSHFKYNKSSVCRHSSTQCYPIISNLLCCAYTLSMKWFRKCWGGASALGQREGVEAAAPTQLVEERSFAEDKHAILEDGTIVTVDKSEWSDVLVGLTYEVQEKDSLGGRALDGAVDVAGSRTFFGAVIVAVVGWAIAGAVTGAPDIWQIIIQDVSSIQVL